MGSHDSGQLYHNSSKAYIGQWIILYIFQMVVKLELEIQPNEVDHTQAVNVMSSEMSDRLSQEKSRSLTSSSRSQFYRRDRKELK